MAMSQAYARQEHKTPANPSAGGFVLSVLSLGADGREGNRRVPGIQGGSSGIRLTTRAYLAAVIAPRDDSREVRLRLATGLYFCRTGQMREFESLLQSILVCDSTFMDRSSWP